ncbi:hypothetical protein UT300012_24410 [Paraclostridium bifermentans]
MGIKEISFVRSMLSNNFRLNGSSVFYATRMGNLFICEVDLNEEHCIIVRTYSCKSEEALRFEGLHKFKELIKSNYR